MSFDYQGLMNNPMFNLGMNMLGQQGYSLDPRDAGLGRAIGNAWSMEQQRKKQQTESMGGATGYLVDRYMKATGADYPTALYAVQTGMRQGLSYENGAIKPMAGLPEAKGAIKFGEQSGANQSDLQYKPQIASQTAYATIAPEAQGQFEKNKSGALGTASGEKIANLGKQGAKIKAFELQNDTIDQKITDILGQAKGIGGFFNTGWVGAKTKDLEGSPAHDLSVNLKTIQADSAFDTLQNMRDNSPTGGALGSVTENELKLLQNAKESLEQSQSQDQFIKNLTNYQMIRRRAFANVQAAHEKDLATFGAEAFGAGLISQPPQSPDAAIAQPASNNLLTPEEQQRLEYLERLERGGQ